MITHFVQKHKVTLQALGYASALALLPMAAAIAQTATGTDPIGVTTTVEPIVLAIARGIAAIAMIWVCLKAMAGNHPIAAVLTVIIGAVAIGKMSTILTAVGLA